MRSRVMGARVGMRSAAAACAVVAVGIVGGCQSDPEPVGMDEDSSLTATYSFGTMTTNVSRGGIGVRDVASAAEAMFRRQGFTVRSAEITSNKARVAGSEVGSGNFQATIVSATKTEAGVRIEVHVEPFGDEAQSRTVMNDILGRLGL